MAKKAAAPKKASAPKALSRNIRGTLLKRFCGFQGDSRPERRQRMLGQRHGDLPRRQV